MLSNRVSGSKRKAGKIPPCPSRVSAETHTEEAAVFSEQDSTTVPKSAYLRFCPFGKSCWGVPSQNPAHAPCRARKEVNVDINNRIVCFDIKQLGKQLKKLGDTSAGSTTRTVMMWGVPPPTDYGRKVGIFPKQKQNQEIWFSSKEPMIRRG